MHKLLWDVEIQTDKLISAKRPDVIIVSEKKDKYLNLAKELKKQWNMKVTIIPIVISALFTVTKGLVQRLEDLEIRGRVEIIQTTALLRSARILRGVLESLKLQWETIG